MHCLPMDDPNAPVYNTWQDLEEMLQYFIYPKEDTSPRKRRHEEDRNRRFKRRPEEITEEDDVILLEHKNYREDLGSPCKRGSIEDSRSSESNKVHVSCK